MVETAQVAVAMEDEPEGAGEDETALEEERDES